MFRSTLLLNNRQCSSGVQLHADPFWGSDHQLVNLWNTASQMLAAVISLNNMFLSICGKLNWMPPPTFWNVPVPMLLPLSQYCNMHLHCLPYRHTACAGTHRNNNLTLLTVSVLGREAGCPDRRKGNLWWDYLKTHWDRVSQRPFQFVVHNNSLIRHYTTYIVEKASLNGLWKQSDTFQCRRLQLCKISETYHWIHLYDVTETVLLPSVDCLSYWHVSEDESNIPRSLPLLYFQIHYSHSLPHRPTTPRYITS